MAQPVRLQCSLELVDGLGELSRQTIAEASEVLTNLWHSALLAVGVDRQDALEVVWVEVEACQVELVLDG